MTAPITIKRHEAVPDDAGSYEVRFADGRAERLFLLGRSAQPAPPAGSADAQRGRGQTQGAGPHRARQQMKHVEPRPFADPQITARKLLELAAGVEPVNGRIHIEKINAPFLSKNGCNATGAEFGAGIRYAVEKGWLELHESGTFVRLIKAEAQ